MKSSRFSEGLKDWAAFFAIAVLGFGTSFYWIKIALEELTPLEVVTYRVTFGAICLWGIAVALKIPIPTNYKILCKLFFAGVIGTSTPFYLITWAEESISSSLTGILNSLTPIFTAILSAIFITRDEFNIKTISGITLGFLGAILIFSKNLEFSSFFLIPLPEFAVVLAAMCYAIVGVYIKINFQKEHPVALSTLSATFAAIFLWVALLFTNAELRFPTQLSSQISIVWMGMISTALAQILLYYLIKKWTPTRVSLIAYVIPIIAMMLGLIMLNETMAVTTIIGSIIILISIFLANQKTKQEVVR